jgi:CMP-N-acetylneuraminic acid synthetase
MVLAVITARGGSNGLPGKNMVELGGRPLIEHTFETAAACSGIDRVLLSTDIPEAVDLARTKYPKIEAPFLRPAELCRDDTSQVAVIEHVLAHLQIGEGWSPRTLVLLQPTSPFRRLQEIVNAIRTFHETRCESLLGVARALHHAADYIYRRKPDDAEFQWVMRDPTWRRRQDFPEVYFNTGALYMCTVAYFRAHGRFYDPSSRLFVMAEESVLDIDTPFDLQLARGWWTHRNEEKSCVLHG